MVNPGTCVDQRQDQTTARGLDGHPSDGNSLPPSRIHRLFRLAVNNKGISTQRDVM